MDRHGSVGVLAKPASNSFLSSPACFTSKRKSRNVAVTAPSSPTPSSRHGDEGRVGFPSAGFAVEGAESAAVGVSSEAMEDDPVTAAMLEEGALDPDGEMSLRYSK